LAIPLERAIPKMSYAIYFCSLGFFLLKHISVMHWHTVILYRASQKDVLNFNNLILEFNIMQVKRISTDGKENSPNLFRHITNVQYVLHT
jgi:hypothetical protein